MTTFTAAELTTADEELSSLADLEPLATNVVRFAFDRTVASVRFVDASAARLHRSRYRHLRSEAPPSFELHVAKRGNATYFWMSGERAYRWDRHALSAREISFLADAVATTHVFSSLHDTIVLHAGAVSDGSGAAAIVGATCAGKTTTTLACARRGLGLYSDEFCVVTPRGVVPFPRTLNLRRGGIDLLSADIAPPSALDAWLSDNGGHDDRSDVGFDELLGSARLPEPRPLRALFLISGHAATPASNPVKAAAMLPRILPWARLRTRGIDAAGELLRLLQGVPCFELLLGAPDASSRLIASVLAAQVARMADRTGNVAAYE
jgi:hypothetical protein